MRLIPTAKIVEELAAKVVQGRVAYPPCSRTPLHDLAISQIPARQSAKESAMPDDHHNVFGSGSEPLREVSHALRKQVVGFHGHTPIILLTIMPPRVAEMVKGQYRKLGR